MLGTPDVANANCTGSQQVASGSGIVIYDANGQEASQASCIDPAAASLLQFPVRQNLLTANAVSAPVTSVRDLVTTSTNSAGESFTVTGSSPVFAIDPKYSSWTMLRSRPSADFTDTWDNAVHTSGVLGVSNGVGVPHPLRVCNQTKYNETLASPGGSVALVPPTMVVGPNNCGLFTLTLTSNGAGGSSYAMTITGG